MNTNRLSRLITKLRTKTVNHLPHIRAFITVFCIENDIECDTYEWDYIISYLWKKLPSMREFFDDKEEFGMYMGEDLC